MPRLTTAYAKVGATWWVLQCKLFPVTICAGLVAAYQVLQYMLRPATACLGFVNL